LLSAFALSTAALWGGAGQALAQPFPDAFDDGCEHPSPPAQSAGTARVVAGPLVLDAVQDASGHVAAYVVESQVPLARLEGSRLRLGFSGFVGGDSVLLTYSPQHRAYLGQLANGTWLGAAPAWAQILFPEIVVAPPPPVVHVTPFPRPPVVVVRPMPRPRVVMPFFRRPPAPPAVVARPSPWQPARNDGRWSDGRDRDGRWNDARDRDGRWNGGRDRGDRRNDGFRNGDRRHEGRGDSDRDARRGDDGRGDRDHRGDGRRGR